MRYRIDSKSDKTAYIQLYEQLRNDIVSGAFPFGARLPSKRLLAEESGVSVITVQHCYEILCDEGYAESRLRRGYFVIYRERDFISSNNPASSNDESDSNYMPNFHRANEIYKFPYSVLSKTMRRVMVDYEDRLLVKSPNHGCAELRQAIARYLARSLGIIVQSQQIIIGSGAEYLYSLLAQLFGNNCIFGLENPSYDKIRRVYMASGIECDMLKMSNDGIKTSELARTQATVLHVTPFNSYPSGVTADVSKRHEYLRWAEARNGFIIEDNFESELTVSKKNDDTVFSLCETGSVIYLNTFSKTIAPSIRVGYMVLPTKLLDLFEEKLGFYSCTVPVFEQYVLAELINSGDFERHINRVRRARRKLFH
ncbi:MAG: PLP-dependent aminotransferase family protein [Ruminococcaceae bacterium]|nr:PLP-dependent aminotransferase family protein [Oscillospiraceae bacterium]